MYKPTFKLILQNISIRKKSRKLFRGRDLIVMKIKPHMLLAGSSTNSPLSSVFVHHKANNCPSMTKISRGQDTNDLSVCTKSEASIKLLRPWKQINDFDLFLAVK